MRASTSKDGMWSFAGSKVPEGHTSWERTAPPPFHNTHQQSLDLEDAEDPCAENSPTTTTKKPLDELFPSTAQ